MRWFEPSDYAQNRPYIAAILTVAAVWFVFILFRREVSSHTASALTDLFIVTSGYFGGGALHTRLKRAGLKWPFLLALAYLSLIVFACDRLAESFPNRTYLAPALFLLLQIPALMLKPSHTRTSAQIETN